MDKIETNVYTSFVKGRMNKDFDERLVPDGEYVDALNIRIGSSEGNSVGAIENTKGNEKLTELRYNGVLLPSHNTKCIGVYEDGANETIYWLVCAPNLVDMVVSFNANDGVITYHVVSPTALSFDPAYLVTGIDLIDNLLFWTDNLNPPRRINVNTPYPSTVTSDDISVIVSPPHSSPTTVGNIAPNEENYVIDKFVSFAYRYKYKNEEYSALSQFSDIAFEPSNFFLDYSTYTNGGMNNVYNNYSVTFKTGGPNVIGIDLCFKLSDSNIINVIEKYDKVEQGWGDNIDQTIQFNNRKIYTTLTESELLRLYDNVPRIAKSQTVMGNRLVYGNYVDGYDVDVKMNYTVAPFSEDVGFYDIPVTNSNGYAYTINPFDVKFIEGSKVMIDLFDVQLKEGSLLYITFNFNHDSFSGDSRYYDTFQIENNFNYNFVFNLTRDYTSAYDLATSPEFVAAINNSSPVLEYVDAASRPIPGVEGTIYVTLDTAEFFKWNSSTLDYDPFDYCSLFSLSDRFNCIIVAKAIAEGTLSAWRKVGSGITSTYGGFRVTSSPGSNIIGIQIPAMRFSAVDSIDDSIVYAYEYFSDASTFASLTERGKRESLHSNRDYEVAIVYMDDYLRSSTALVNTFNTVFFPSITSVSRNYIRATVNNLAPSWATSYKFVVKPSKSVYETVYSTLFFNDSSSFTWFKLEGDNVSKVKVDDILIVKVDTSGPVESLIKTKVLDVQVLVEDWIATNGDTIEPGGVYMKLRASNFAAQYAEDSFITPYQYYSRTSLGSGSKPQRAFYMSKDNPDFDPLAVNSSSNQRKIPYAIPAGSIVKFDIWMHRYSGGQCRSYDYRYISTVVANNNYDDFQAFIEGQNIDFTTVEVTGGYSGTIDKYQNNTLSAFDHQSTATATRPAYPKMDYAPNRPNTLSFLFRKTKQDGNDDGGIYFVLATGLDNCADHDGYITATITIQQSNGTLIFETEPLDSDGEIFFEGSDSFPIVNRYHMSGDSITDQDQTSSVPAIVDLNFFDCFSFGNGVESYKIQDSLTGMPFYLGSRVTAVSQEDFKEAHRYADLTYSGVYNAETNINKLNEFNLALSNWKECEKSFGPINKIYARKTDILVLQEDKISGVLAGKNLLSDAAGGGALTSIPEVLGTQIARLEDYGISNNPESFASFGNEVYFTDYKRNAVLNLRGGSINSDQLEVTSNAGLKNWFRDSFKQTVNKQRIGGFDPYMNEYVISFNNDELPTEAIVRQCGLSISQHLVDSSNSFTVDLGKVVGNTVINYQFFGGTSATIQVVYNEIIVVNELISGTGSVSFDKDDMVINEAIVTISSLDANYNLTVLCPFLPTRRVHTIVLNSGVDAGDTIHAIYNWSDGDFTSPSNINGVTLSADGVALNRTLSGQASSGVIPYDGTNVVMRSSKLITDTFNFNITANSFKYYISETEISLETLIPLLEVAGPISNVSDGVYQVAIKYDNPDAYENLYLVWDLVNSTPVSLLYDESDPAVACGDSTEDPYYIDAALFEDASSVYTDIYLTLLAPDGYYAIDGQYRQQVEGSLLTLTDC